MSHPMRWYLLPVLAAGLVFLAGAAPVAAATPAAPLATPGQAIAFLVKLFPDLGCPGNWLGVDPPRHAPFADETQGESVGTVSDGDEDEPDHLPAPDEAPARDGGYGGWGDEASGPWPRS